MKTTSSVALLALAASTVHAQGIIDNVKTFVKLTTDTIDLSGDYYIQNAKTGKYLYFDRPGDTTNLITGNDKQSVTLGQDSQYGQSGAKWQNWAGTYIRGLEKCASSQWGHDVGYNIAAVSYACKVGGGKDGSDSLEVAKQFWKLVSCGDSSDDTPPSASSSPSSSSSSSSSSSKKAVNLNAQVKLAAAKPSSSNDDSSASASSDSTSTVPSKTNKYGDWEPKQTKTLDKSDRTTWICKHPGWWLAAHSGYVYEAGHVECKDDLENYWQQQKKRELGFQSHERMHKRNKKSLIEKRGSSHRVCILAVDHSLDMETRAITPSVIDTFGGYKSVALANFDDSDESQHWIVTSA